CRGALVKVRLAKRPLVRAVRGHEQLRADRREARRAHHGHERRAAVLARDRRVPARCAHGRYSSTNTSISPPQGSPTSHASASAIPKWSSRGSPLRRTSLATSTTAPSTPPPE